MKTSHALTALFVLTSGLAEAQPRRPAPLRRPLAPVARAATVAPPSPTQAIESPGFALRPIDRATVRIVAIQGVSGRFGRGRAETLRLIASPTASFGSGVVVANNGTILTARHVIEGADLLAVVFPGQRVAVAAAPIYSDPSHDIAFVRVQTTRPIADVMPLPDASGPLTSGQRVLVSGYPLNPEERYPAAVSGDFARLNIDGRIQLSISVNHGNSGGPVLDETGRLIGVVSARGEPERGVEGLSLVEPIQYALEPWRREARALPAHVFGPDDARVAQSVFDLLRLDPERDLRDPASADRVLAMADARLAPEASAVVGAQSWNEALLLLESNRAATIAALPAEQRARAESLVRLADTFTRGALREAPYLRTHYPFLHWFARINGNVAAPPPAPLRENDDAQGEPYQAEAPRPVTAANAPPPPPSETPAEARLRAFVEQRVRLRVNPAGVRSPRVTLRLRVSASGLLQAGSVQQGTGDAACDADLATQLTALVQRHPRVETLTSNDALSIADRDVQVTISLSP